MNYVASCSFGKDSTAMVLKLIEENYPLDEVVFYDTGMEFNAIYDTRDRVVSILNTHGIKYTELKPENSFLYDMLERPVYSKQKGFHYGYGWCGGPSRWGTTNKQRVINKYIGEGSIQYIGIAADEHKRLERLASKSQVSPLADYWNMSESDCLKFCYERGFYWKENGIRLYDILDRVSCWCCRNKNKRELNNIYRYLPDYWNKLKSLQDNLNMPMKSFNNSKYGFYGDLYIMENVFREEAE